MLLDCDRLQLGMEGLRDFLSKNNAVYTKVDCMSVRVTGPKAFIEELEDAADGLSFPFFDPSH